MSPSSTAATTPVLHFSKMHGAGNDFVVFWDGPKLTAEQAQKICDRNFGIGADQILALSPSKSAHAKMDIFNADGSNVEMCGNGLRAAALYLEKYGPEPHLKEYKIETPPGIQTAKFLEPQKIEVCIEVNLGSPTTPPKPKEPIEIGNHTFEFHEVGFGNPHAVIFAEDESQAPLLGPRIETHSRFPDRTNVEFSKLRDSKNLDLIVWERGAGLTLACGSGACAAATASIRFAGAESPLNVHLPGGTLTVRWDGKDESPVYLSGPAEEVYVGEYPLKA